MDVTGCSRDVQYKPSNSNGHLVTYSTTNELQLAEIPIGQPYELSCRYLHGLQTRSGIFRKDSHCLPVAALRVADADSTGSLLRTSILSSTTAYNIAWLCCDWSWTISYKLQAWYDTWHNVMISGMLHRHVTIGYSEILMHWTIFHIPCLISHILRYIVCVISLCVLKEYRSHWL